VTVATVGLFSVVALGASLNLVGLAVGLTLLGTSTLGDFAAKRRADKFNRVFNFGIEREAIELAVAPENLLLSALNAYHALRNLPWYAQFVDWKGDDDKVNLVTGRMLKPCLEAMMFTLDNWGKLSSQRGHSDTDKLSIRSQYDQLLSPLKRDLPLLERAYSRGVTLPLDLLATSKKVGGVVTAGALAISFLGTAARP
jgi:hypothetical protein